MDVPRDDAAFLSLLGEVLAVLDAPAPPRLGPGVPDVQLSQADEGVRKKLMRG